MWWPGMVAGLAPAGYRPRRGPSTMTPASAAHPPKLCTTVEPEKSRIPRRARNPPPQIQCPEIGYSTAVRISENTRNELYFMRSLTEPDTIVADVPQNT